jgi:hypothetical protein
MTKPKTKLEIYTALDGRTAYHYHRLKSDIGAQGTCYDLPEDAKQSAERLSRLNGDQGLYEIIDRRNEVNEANEANEVNEGEPTNANT